MITVYASIGNSDDKLTQAHWADFVGSFRAAIVQRAEAIHGEWFSLPHSPFQNCCVCFEIDEEDVPSLKSALAAICAERGQDSIAWAVADTEFIKAGEPS